MGSSEESVPHTLSSSSSLSVLESEGKGACSATKVEFRVRKRDVDGRKSRCAGKKHAESGFSARDDGGLEERDRPSLGSVGEREAEEVERRWVLNWTRRLGSRQFGSRSRLEQLSSVERDAGGDAREEEMEQEGEEEGER